MKLEHKLPEIAPLTRVLSVKSDFSHPDLERLEQLPRSIGELQLLEEWEPYESHLRQMWWHMCVLHIIQFWTSSAITSTSMLSRKMLTSRVKFQFIDCWGWIWQATISPMCPPSQNLDLSKWLSAFGDPLSIGSQDFFLTSSTTHLVCHGLAILEAEAASPKASKACKAWLSFDLRACEASDVGCLPCWSGSPRRGRK